MRGQLSALAVRLEAACDLIAPPAAAEVARRAEHLAVLERRVVIEKRKEEAERVVRDRLRKEAAARQAEELARKAEEDRRLEREQKLREREKLQKIQEEMEALEKKRYLTAMGRSVDNMTAAEL